MHRVPSGERAGRPAALAETEAAVLAAVIGMMELHQSSSAPPSPQSSAQQTRMKLSWVCRYFARRGTDPSIKARASRGNAAETLAGNAWADPKRIELCANEVKPDAHRFAN